MTRAIPGLGPDSGPEPAGSSLPCQNPTRHFPSLPEAPTKGRSQSDPADPTLEGSQARRPPASRIVTEIRLPYSGETGFEIVGDSS